MTRPGDWSPLRGRDPVGGDPVELEQLARQYAATANALTDAARALRAVHEHSTTWKSPAGQGFRERAVGTVDTLDRAFRRYDETATALATYAVELTEVQRDADATLARARLAQDEHDDAERARLAASYLDDVLAVTRFGHEAAQARARIDRADRDLREAEQAWRRAGDRAAQALEDAGRELDDRRRWGGLLSVVSRVAGAAGTLSAVFGVLSLVCLAVPGLQGAGLVFGALGLATGLVALAGDAVLLGQDEATAADVAWDLVGVVSFGAGRAFSFAGRRLAAVARGRGKPALVDALTTQGLRPKAAKAQARRDGVTKGGREAAVAAARASTRARPTGAEWVEAYRPSRLLQAPASAPTAFAGTEALPPVAEALRRGRTAVRAGRAANGAGGAASTRQLGAKAIDDAKEPEPCRR